MKEISLTQGKVAIVDDADYEWLSQFKWSAMGKKGLWYAARTVWENGKPRTILMHRDIAGTAKGKHTDHKDNDGLNNRRDNLRECTFQENLYNQRKRKQSTSIFKGISWHRQSGKWKANIKVDNWQVELGEFTSEINAAMAVDLAAIKYHGEFAYLNTKIIINNPSLLAGVGLSQTATISAQIPGATLAGRN